jgi:hypothetical protein
MEILKTQIFGHKARNQAMSLITNIFGNSGKKNDYNSEAAANFQFCGGR